MHIIFERNFAPIFASYTRIIKRVRALKQTRQVQKFSSAKCSFLRYILIILAKIETFNVSTSDRNSDKRDIYSNIDLQSRAATNDTSRSVV